MSNNVPGLIPPNPVQKGRGGIFRKISTATSTNILHYSLTTKADQKFSKLW
jgi:hypothetical protein